MKLLTPNNYEIISTNDMTNVRFYTSKDSGSYVAPHWHDALELILLQDGELYFSMEDQKRFPVKIGQCILARPNLIHATLCTKPNTAIVFQIPMAFLQKYIPNAKQLSFQLQDPSPDPIVQTKIDIFKNTLLKMQVLIEQDSPEAMLKFNSLLFDALYQLIHNFSYTVSLSAVTKRDKQLDRLKDVLNYILLHYNEPISLETISSIAMYEPKYFCRFFKGNMGSTFLEYQNNIRLSKIYTDLQKTDDKIYDILDRHGFTNYKLFRRMFHEQFHTTPSEVRKHYDVTQ